VYSKKHTKKQTQKSWQKGIKKEVRKAAKKLAKTRQKSTFLNQSCCCLETGLKPIRFIGERLLVLMREVRIF